MKINAPLPANPKGKKKKKKKEGGGDCGLISLLEMQKEAEYVLNHTIHWRVHSGA